MSGMVSFIPVCRAFGFFNNDGGPISATAAAAQNTNIVADVTSGNVGRHLRTQIQETGGAAGTAGDAYQLQAEKNDSGIWFNVTTTSSGVRAFDSTLVHGNGVTTSRLTGGTGTFESTGRCTETGVTPSAVVGASNHIENLHSIEVVQADVVNNDFFDFRHVLNGSTFSNTVTPRITVTAPLADITGTLDATETGSDTFAADGEVLVSGSLDATETGSDVFAATGTVTEPGITGILDAQESGSDSFAAAGEVLVSGTLVAAESGADGFSASGEVAVSGALDAQETGGDVFAATGELPIAGVLDALEVGSDTFAATGTVDVGSITGQLAAVETGSDTFSARLSLGAVVPLLYDPHRHGRIIDSFFR